MIFMVYVSFSILLLRVIIAENDLQLVSKAHSDYLRKFTGYGSAVIIHFQVPDDTEFVSFKFNADQTQFSLFRCNLDEVILYMKHGSIPLVNANDARLPEHFFNVTHSPLMHLHFLSDKQSHYINLTTPRAGYYYATAFHPFVNPLTEGITQAGLTPDCGTFIDASLYIKKYFIIDLERSNEIDITVPLYSKENQTYKFYIPEEHDRLILMIKHIDFCSICTELMAQFFDNSGSTAHFNTIIIAASNYVNDTVYYHVGVLPATCMTDLYRSAVFKSLRNEHLISYVHYKEYNLVRSGTTESFFFNFDLHPNSDGTVPLSINLTSTDFTSLKFFLNEAVDIGGNLDYVIGFAPRITRQEGVIKKTAEPENHIVIACIRNTIMEIPTWPNLCVYGNDSNIAPIILNKTLINSSLVLPYPDSGWWYMTLKLFCGECTRCECPEACVNKYNGCIRDCEVTCKEEECSNCTTGCESMIINETDCGSKCDCDGPCQRTNVTCNSSILFDISSFPCIGGSCGKNGRCVFMISQGILYSTCLCSNNYKGLDCGDDTHATPYAMIILEFCLLVLSNLIFVPAAYVAYKKKFYVEMIVYLSAFLSSSFYHMCDAGENIISICLVKLDVLQFSDFFSGLLAIWVTLIAVAAIPLPWSSISHITGALVLAFGTTLSKQSLIVFLVPVITGVIIIIGHWIYLRRKIGKSFPNRRYVKIYLPLALLVTGAGLLMYGLFQTQSNYKYLHSLWHISMGLGIIIILPDMKTFLPKREVQHNDELLQPVVDRTPPTETNDIQVPRAFGLLEDDDAEIAWC
ncbi:five-span transmembrane protein m83 [Holotrichia oblita]|uniref:Five-span transmembrane protein m83 n=1 Tax=Holotrichia oblita TaxID=644536 RepID=A0ACB9TQI5_HOLOL|nr:five-span transmembrane protein m83 [Holotrichia oblita]